MHLIYYPFQVFKKRFLTFSHKILKFRSPNWLISKTTYYYLLLPSNQVEENMKLIIQMSLIILLTYWLFSCLNWFKSRLFRFPNLVVGIISRESIRQALKSGITAEQIVSFLRQHAHPECYKELPVLPPTIADQIKLWAIERDRFTFNEGVLYNQFLSQADFEVLKNFAQELGVLVWHNTARRTMVVTKNGHDDVKKFWKKHSKGGNM